MNSGCLFYVILFMTISSSLACKSSPPEKKSEENEDSSSSSTTTETILYFTKVTPDDNNSENNGQQTETELNERPRAANVNNNEIDDNDSTVSSQKSPTKCIFLKEKQAKINIFGFFLDINQAEMI